jgi:hypothetical protein
MGVDTADNDDAAAIADMVDRGASADEDAIDIDGELPAVVREIRLR